MGIVRGVRFGASALQAGVAGLIARRLLPTRQAAPMLSPELASLVEEVTFPSSDGLVLWGWFLSGGPAADSIVVCHGYRGSRGETLGLGLKLQAAGHNVLLFDFRAHGLSEGELTSLGAKEVRDLSGAVTYLRSRPGIDPDRIGGLGFSMGASVLILAAARLPDIRAVVADSAFAHIDGVVDSWLRGRLPRPLRPLRQVLLPAAQSVVGASPTDVQPIGVVGSIAPRPVMFIHGTADDLIPCEHARRLHAAAGEPRGLWLVPWGHVEARDAEPEAYLARIDQFFATQLRRLA